MSDVVDTSVPDALADRYASPAMVAIWSPRAKILLEREFWIAVMRAQRVLGLDIPEEAIASYERVKNRIDLEGIRKRERVTRHDVKARLVRPLWMCSWPASAENSSILALTS